MTKSGQYPGCKYGSPKCVELRFSRIIILCESTESTGLNDLNENVWYEEEF